MCGGAQATGRQENRRLPGEALGGPCRELSSLEGTEREASLLRVCSHSQGSRDADVESLW